MCNLHTPKTEDPHWKCIYLEEETNCKVLFEKKSRHTELANNANDNNHMFLFELCSFSRL